MKKTYIAIMIIIMLSATITTHINAVYAVYIQNNYGSSIACKKQWNPERKPINADEGEVIIPNGQTIQLDRLYTLQIWNPTILIRRAGIMGPLSPYTNLKPYIDQIINDNDPHRIAIISINSGGTLLNPWDINIIYQ